MPFGTRYYRSKTFTAPGQIYPADINSLQDDLGNQINDISVAGAVTAGAAVRRGATNIATSEARTNVAYGLLATPDQVTGVVVPYGAKLQISFQALWQETVAGAARAAIFIGSNQIKIQSSEHNGPVTQAAATGPGGGPTGINNPLFSTHWGLCSVPLSSGASADVTTGQAVGCTCQNTATLRQPTCEINTTVRTAGDDNSGTYLHFSAGGWVEAFVAPGTYTISVQYRATSGTVTASARKLWVRSKGY
jgi:hypothetical protein